MNETTNLTPLEALRMIGSDLRVCHYGRMPDDVQEAYDKVFAALAQPAQAPAQPAPQPSASDEIERVERLMARAEAHDAAQEWRSKPSAVEALAKGETK